MKLIASILLLMSFLYCSFQKGKNITILTVENVKIIKKENDPALLKACMNWKLSKENVKDFFNNAHLISSIEKTSNYYHLPCEIKGTLKRNDTTFAYTINAGATAVLTYKDNIYAYYGCSKKSCEHLFLMMPDELDK